MLKSKSIMARWVEKIFPHGGVAIVMTTMMLALALLVASMANITVKKIMEGFAYDVIIILISMELFTNLVVGSGVIEWLATKLSVASKGRKRVCLLCFGGLMFVISCTLNNITAVMIVLPVIFVLLRSIDVDRQYMNVFLAVILALSNTGGAASPIGDFPAIVIMTSGVTTFMRYLLHAFPLFLVTSLLLVVVWSCFVRDSTSKAERNVGIMLLNSQYKNHNVRWGTVSGLGIVFVAMFLAWSIIPQDIVPPEGIAMFGYACAAAFCAWRKEPVAQNVNLQAVLLLSSFLFFSTTIGQTGWLSEIAGVLQASIKDPVLLLVTIMVMTSICAGLFSAGPAAAAMMPVIKELCATSFAGQADWVAVAYAASICAGSSLLMSSATAGFILSDRVNKAQLPGIDGQMVEWNFKDYIKFGVVNYLIQMTIAIIWILIVCRNA